MLGEYDYPEGACACVDDNAQMCYEIRYDIDNDDNEEICDCACHAADNLDEHDGDEYYAGQFFGRR